MLTVVKSGGLAGGGGAHRRVKADERAVSVRRHCPDGQLTARMADANAAYGLAFGRHEPVYVAHAEALSPYGGIVGGEADFVRLRADIGNVHALPEADAEAAALADGLVKDAAVLSHGLAV